MLVRSRTEFALRLRQADLPANLDDLEAIAIPFDLMRQRSPIGGLLAMVEELGGTNARLCTGQM
jgi:hypothetical protein